MVNHKRLRNLAGGGMSGMLNVQIRQLEDPGWQTSLNFPVPYPEIASSLGAKQVEISRSMRWNGVQLACRDVVFLNLERTYLVVVVGCLKFDDRFGLIIKFCTRTSCTGTASCWDVDPSPTWYRLVNEIVLRVTAFKYISANMVEVIH